MSALSGGPGEPAHRGVPSDQPPPSVEPIDYAAQATCWLDNMVRELRGRLPRHQVVPYGTAGSEGDRRLSSVEARLPVRTGATRAPRSIHVHILCVPDPTGRLRWIYATSDGEELGSVYRPQTAAYAVIARLYATPGGDITWRLERPMTGPEPSGDPH